MKFCKDCAFKDYYDNCRNPNTTTYCPVEGIPSYTSCFYNRKKENLCGPDAKWFVAKKPVFNWFRKQKIDLSTDS